MSSKRKLQNYLQPKSGIGNDDEPNAVWKDIKLPRSWGIRHVELTSAQPTWRGLIDANPAQIGVATSI
ncbi:hypothetical protein CR513_56826, partial [Mucuna pruriens]